MTIKEKKEFRKLVSKIESLPTLPYVINKLTKILENPMVSAEEVNRVISADQVLTAKILKLVNSAFYGFPGQISTVTHAIVILGFTAVKSVAISASVFDMFPMKGSAFEFDRQKFWQHSIATAVISKMLAKIVNYQEEEVAFVAGLLHDIGKVILDRYFHDVLEQVMEEVHSDDISFYEAELRVMDCNHQNIGLWLAEKWSLPAELRESISYHHNPEKAGIGFKLAGITHMADVLARAKNIGNGGDSLIPKISHEAWELVNLKEPELAYLLDEIDNEIEKAEIFFSMTQK